MDLAIETEGLVKTYPKGVRALDGLDFAVERGTIFALLGPNGAGKSTTVKILTTLTRPDAGEASVAGHDVLRDAQAVRRSIGVVGQKHGVDPEATGHENLVLQGRSTIPQRRLNERVAELLERFNLTAARDRLVKTYSGGMQRRLDIAMGLLHRPERALPRRADDRARPGGARRHVGGDRPARARGGVTILLTTHYLDEADELASQVAIVDRGRIVAPGRPRS